MRFGYDKSSKWLLQHHARAMLWLGGFRDVETCKPVQTDLVQPRQLPDGLIEMRRTGRSQSDLCLIEITTFPANDVPQQLVDDLMLVHQVRRQMPEVLVLVLHPKGNLDVAGQATLATPSGGTGCTCWWKVVKLWEMEAEPLLALDDPGLVPWITLMHTDRPPQELLQRCRDIIDRKADPAFHEQLATVTHILGNLVYNEDILKGIFGGKEHMIESPILMEIINESEAKGEIKAMQSAILRVLQNRFGAVPEQLTFDVRAVRDMVRLESLLDLVTACPSLDDFRAGM